jgi:hypothetical protein
MTNSQIKTLTALCSLIGTAAWAVAMLKRAR